MNKLRKFCGKGFKKALAAISALCVLCAVGAVTASAESTGNLKVSSCSAEKGTTVSVTVTLEANPGMFSAVLKIGYDKSALTLKSADNGAVFSGTETMMGDVSANPFTYSGYAAGVKNVTANGKVVTLNFTVNNNAALGSYPVTVTQATGYTDSYKKLNIPSTGGNVTVVNCVHSVKEWRVTKTAECEKAGTETQTCKKCGATFGTRAISATGHKNTEIRNAVAATKTADGYTGDTYCKTCGKLISKGKVIAKINNSKPASGSGSQTSSVSSASSSSSSSDTSSVSDSSSSGGSEPEMTSGKDLIFDREEKQPLRFVSDADFDEFIRVEIDGTVLDKSDYTAESGSTIITVNADCLEKLSDGFHNISIVSTGGTATAQFTVGAAADNNSSEQTAEPDTGDTDDTENKRSATPVIIAIILVVILTGGVAAFTVIKRRRW